MYKEHIDISIVIVNFNVKDFLYQCLKSINKARGNLHIQTIVVDNNSADGSIEFVKPLFPDVEYIELSNNIGFGKANNIGFKKSKGKYILILNPDTIIQEDTLETMFQYMEQNPDVGVSGCKVLNSDGSFQYACRRGFPTPWNAFSKLFGLQAMFPKSKLFAQYNQTYKSENETYEIDALIGAFMFARADVIKEVNGFDEKFFMYGEDLDLCFRIKKAGYKVQYVHTTSIIHYKGESTRRSDINDIHHFYKAMEIYAKKHFAYSFLFLLFLKMGIIFRSFIAYTEKYKKDLLIILSDTLFINLSLIVSSKIRFGKFFPFLDYAYPDVFIVITIVLVLSMFLNGEYFENNNNIAKAVFGVLISFFILSSLTYFFNQYAFSRGVLLLTSGFMLLYAVLSRLIIFIISIYKGKEAEKRVLFVGLNEHTNQIVNELNKTLNTNLSIIGVLSSEKELNYDNAHKLSLFGSTDSLKQIVYKNRINEVIITDSTLSKNKLIELISSVSDKTVRFHIADEYEQLITSRIINDLLEKDFNIHKYSYLLARNKFIKRLTDIIISIFMLIILFPIKIFVKKFKNTYIKFYKVIINKMSIVGLTENSKWNYIGKPGIISFTNIIDVNSLRTETLERLNEHYLSNYSFALDIDIFFKFMLRGKNVKSGNS